MPRFISGCTSQSTRLYPPALVVGPIAQTLARLRQVVRCGYWEERLRHPVGSVEELRNERCRVVELEGRQVGVISVDRCPHRPAQICEGTVGGTFLGSAPRELRYGRHQRVLRCPWHGWEFDLETGRSLLEPDRFGLRVYPVSVHDDTVFVDT